MKKKKALPTFSLAHTADLQISASYVWDKRKKKRIYILLCLPIFTDIDKKKILRNNNGNNNKWIKCLFCILFKNYTRCFPVFNVNERYTVCVCTFYHLCFLLSKTNEENVVKVVNFLWKLCSLNNFFLLQFLHITQQENYV